MKLEYLTNWDKQKLAERINIPRAILRELATDEEWRIRANVAKNPNATGKLLVTLFEYEKTLKIPMEDVIRTIYLNEKLPEFAKRVIETLFGKMLD